MYKITIKNYYQNGTLNKNETTLYNIPIQNSEKDRVLTDPIVSVELGKTGTMEFTIHPNHPYYHAFAQMRTIMRVEYDGDTIFRGRILTIDNTMSGAKRIHCEGDMAFLLDSIQMGTKKESRSSKTLNTYITEILNLHNSQMQESGETDKCIYPGYIPGAYPSSITSMQQIANVSDTFGSNNMEQSMNALETLMKEYGGFFRTRYSSSNGRTYLDWCRYWFRNDTANKQPIAITQNIIDAQSNSEVDNIFTALIPIGANEGEDVFITGYRTDIHGDNNRILVPQIAQVFSANELNTGYMTKALFEKAISQYGIIYRVQTFPNADTQEKLWEYACDWIKNNYVGGITSYDLSAIDMHHINNKVSKYLTGDRIELTIHSDMTELDEYNSNKLSNTVNRTLLSAKYDLHHPEKNGYTAGIPSDILNREYGTKSTSKATASGGGGGGGGKGAGGRVGGGNNTNDDAERERLAREKAQDALAWKLVWDETYNNKEYNALKKIANGVAVKPALNTSQLIIKQIISDPEIDTGKEVFETTAMVLNGQKQKALITANPLALGNAQVADKMMRLKAKYSPALRELIEMDEGYQKAVTSISLNAGLKQVGVSGKKDAALNAILDGALALGLTDDTPLDEAVSMISSVTNRVTSPTMVASFGSSADANGNEAGNMLLGKEGLTNVGLDAGGNDGKGTAKVGVKQGKWLIQMNEPLSYSEGGTIKTLKDGVIDADDYSILKGMTEDSRIPSISAQVGVFKTLIAENLVAINATISNLNALTAEIDELTSKMITTEDLNAVNARVTNLMNGNLGAGYIRTNNLAAGAIKLDNKTLHTRNLTIEGVTYNIVTWS